MSRTATLLTRLAMLIVFLGAWEVLPRAGIVNPMLLPPLSQVLATLGDIVARSDFREAMAVTAAEVVVAFVIAVPLGAALGVLLAENAYLGAIFRPMLFYVFSIPKSIFLPMFILVFGVGFGHKVGLGFFSSIFFVFMST